MHKSTTGSLVSGVKVFPFRPAKQLIHQSTCDSSQHFGPLLAIHCTSNCLVVLASSDKCYCCILVINYSPLTVCCNPVLQVTCPVEIADYYECVHCMFRICQGRKFVRGTAWKSLHSPKSWCQYTWEKHHNKLHKSRMTGQLSFRLELVDYWHLSVKQLTLELLMACRLLNQKQMIDLLLEPQFRLKKNHCR